eukprot:gene10773-13191_t
MLPLDTISNNNVLNDLPQISNQLSILSQQTEITGIMTDVWWGLVETEPQQYNWTAYDQLFSIVQKSNLKIKVTLSFHECGGNVGDTCSIPLPSWVRAVGETNPDIYYTDQSGNRDQEYLSCGIDNLPLFNGRTPVEIYSDFMKSFKQEFGYLMPDVLTEVQVGLGPAGEMRYPSYQLAYWTFPGVGEFQCYDKYMLKDLATAANASGNPLWGLAGPDNAGDYNSYPQDTGFFNDGYNNFQSDYGQFFLNWYSQYLIQHGSRILSQANYIFSGSGVVLAAKVSGVHWWYNTPSHAAELTAGYKNDQGKAYDEIAQMFKQYNVSFDFTCLEMLDSEQPSYCDCGPQELVSQTLLSAQSAGIHYSGENALPRFDQTAYSQIEYQSSRYYLIQGFSYLRLSDQLLQNPNLNLFQNFVSSMKSL